MGTVTDQQSPYLTTLADLHAERAAAVRMVSDCDQAIAAIQRVMKTKGTPLISGAGLPATSSATAKLSVMPSPLPGRRFSNISVRWSILILLDEAAAPMSQAEITEALEAEGIRAKSRAKDFGNNVSAVLSSMRGAHAEIETTDGKFRITEKGRSAIHHIKLTRGIA
jgi:hypothetical protein